MSLDKHSNPRSNPLLCLTIFETALCLSVICKVRDLAVYGYDVSDGSGHTYQMVCNLSRLHLKKGVEVESMSPCWSFDLLVAVGAFGH
jgi:hypothetical protein